MYRIVYEQQKAGTLITKTAVLTVGVDDEPGTIGLGLGCNDNIHDTTLSQMKSICEVVRSGEDGEVAENIKGKIE